MATIKIFALDGSLQCDSTPGIVPQVMVDELAAAGVEARFLFRKRAPLPVPTVCGAPTGMALVLEIPLKSLPAALALPRGYQAWLFDYRQVDVYKFDGSLQCQDNEPAPPQVTAAELAQHGIQVAAVRKDQVAVPRVCGFPTGAINVATIDSDDFPKAQALQFQLLSVLLDEPDAATPARQFLRMAEAGRAAALARLSLTPEFPPEPMPGPSPLPWPLPWPRPGAPLFPRPRLPVEPELPALPIGSRHPHQLISELPGHQCRVIRPGDVVTRDLRFERFNILLDEHGVITGVGFY